MKKISVTVKGDAPLLMHNPILANPLHPMTKEIKKISGKNKKTDEDHAEMSRLEFLAGSYYDKDKGGWYLPGEMMMATIINSARQTKKGKLVEQALIVPGHATFSFKHQSLSPEKIFATHREYVDLRPVVVGRNRIVRTRPKFPVDDSYYWEVSFEALLDDVKLNLEDLKDIIINAGQYIGFGDFRPRFGRFELVKFNAE